MAKMTASVFTSLVPSSKDTTVSVNAFIFDLVITWPERMTLGRSLLLWEIAEQTVEIKEVTRILGYVGSSFRFKLCLIHLAHRYKSFTILFRKCVLLLKR